MTIRLHLLCSASTPATRAVAFPADDPLDAHGRDSMSRFPGRLPAFDKILRSPALCAAQTAQGLGLAATSEPQLRDCDFGRWTGRAFADVQAREPEALARWLHDPRAAPHGGESFAAVMARVGGWMNALAADSGTVLAIAHSAILRAAIACALSAGPEAFSHIDIAPLSRVKLSGGGGRWTLTALIPLKDAR